MIKVIIRFLNMDVMNYHEFIPWALLVVWIALLFAAFSSLRNQTFSTQAALAWGLAILLLPIVGMACYAIRCLFDADWTFIRPLLRTKSQAVNAVAIAGKENLKD